MSAALDCGYGHACGFCTVEDSCHLDKPKHNKRLIENRLDRIDQIIMVLANKGGVGKSTIACNLAVALARRGYRVGLGDADIHGPNAAKLLGAQEKRIRVRDSGIEPHTYQAQNGNRLKLGSLHFFLPDADSPVVWRDAYKFDYIHHLVGSFEWGPLDFWVLDMPPGTGNELITLSDLLEGCNLTALLVTTPQSVALLDTMKAARFCRERGMPIAGVVENMAGMVCPHCGGDIELFPREDLVRQLGQKGLKPLIQLPISPLLAQGSDAGEPVVDAQPNSEEAKLFMDLADGFIAKVNEAEAELATRHLSEVLVDEQQQAAINEALNVVPEDEVAAVRRQVEELLGQEQQRLLNRR